MAPRSSPNSHPQIVGGSAWHSGHPTQPSSVALRTSLGGPVATASPGCFSRDLSHTSSPVGSSWPGLETQHQSSVRGAQPQKGSRFTCMQENKSETSCPRERVGGLENDRDRDHETFRPLSLVPFIRSKGLSLWAPGTSHKSDQFPGLPWMDPVLQEPNLGTIAHLYRPFAELRLPPLLPCQALSLGLTGWLGGAS